MAAQKFLANIDLQGQELQNASLEKRTAPTYAQGRVYEDTTTAINAGFGSFFRIFFGENTAFKSLALTDEIVALKSYIDNLAVKGIRTQGTISYSFATTYPTNPTQTGQAGIGSGTAGAIMQGDAWFVTVAGVFGTKNVVVGDLIIATTNAPGNVDANRAILQADLDDATTVKKGITRIATQVETLAGTEAFAYITPATLAAVMATQKTRTELFAAQVLVANTAKTITLGTAMVSANAFDVSIKQGVQVVYAQVDAVNVNSFTITASVGATVDVFVTYKVV